MNKQDMMKVQTCLLRVNIHCDGCKAKVKKKLQKVPGVYKVNIDSDQGKVTVSGNVDPQLLINKLEKSGKHAELLGGAKNGQASMNNLFNNFNFGKLNNGGKDNNGSQKGGKNNEKGGHQQSKDLKLLGKNQKSANLSFSDDEMEDEVDDEESDDEFVVPQPSKKAAKAAGGGGHGQALKSKSAPNDSHLKGHKGDGKGEKVKKGAGGLDAFLKGLMGKAAGKKGKDDSKNGSKAESGDQNHGVGKKGGKNVDFVIGDGKNGAKKGKDGKNNGKNNDNWGKKGGEKHDGGLKMENKLQGMNEMNANHMGGFGGKNMGAMGNYHPMGQMGGFRSPMENFPAASAMNMGHGNPYNNPQFMAQMMMNQQRGNGQDMYHHPMMLGQPHPAMNHYGPPPVNDQFTHYFSDENTSSCSIM